MFKQFILYFSCIVPGLGIIEGVTIYLVEVMTVGSCSIRGAF